MPAPQFKTSDCRRLNGAIIIFSERTVRVERQCAWHMRPEVAGCCCDSRRPDGCVFKLPSRLRRTLPARGRFWARVKTVRPTFGIWNSSTTPVSTQLPPLKTYLQTSLPSLYTSSTVARPAAADWTIAPPSWWIEAVAPVWSASSRGSSAVARLFPVCRLTPVRRRQQQQATCQVYSSWYFRPFLSYNADNCFLPSMFAKWTTAEDRLHLGLHIFASVWWFSTRVCVCAHTHSRGFQVRRHAGAKGTFESTFLRILRIFSRSNNQNKTLDECHY